MTNKFKVLVTGLVLGCFLLAACGGGASKDKKADSGKKADDGNVLVVYNCNTDDWTAPVIKQFQEETGIKVQTVAGGSGEQMARVRAEKDNPLGDVLWGGSGDAYIPLLKYLEPYNSKETSSVIDRFLVKGNAYYNDVADPYVIAYNTDLVSKDEAPTGWADLLNPKWKGKIALADPAKSSSTYAALLSMMENMGGDETIIEKLVENLDHKIISSSAAQIKSLSDGEYAITATYEEPVLKYIKNGAHMQVVYPKEGTCIGTGGIGLIKGCKHPENAKKFIDFVMSKKVQDGFANYSRRSTRKDVTPSTNMLAFDKFKYTPLNFDKAVSYKDTFLKKWREAVTK